MIFSYLLIHVPQELREVVIGARASSVAERSQSRNCFKWSAKRSASASSVNVAFAQPPVGYTPVLQIQRFLKSMTLQWESTTPSRAASLLFIRHVPIW